MNFKKQDLTFIDNEFNGISVKNMTEISLKMFFAIGKCAEKKGKSELTFSYAEIKYLSGYKSRSMSRLGEDIRKMNELINSSTLIRIEDPLTGNIVQRGLFDYFETNDSSKIATFKINSNFLHFFNDFTQNYTSLDMEHIRSFSSKYTIRLYSLLCQYKNTGQVFINIEKFILLLDIPNSYVKKKRIKEKVIDICLRELGTLEEFKSLRCINIKKNGKTITGYEFLFDPFKFKSKIAQKRIPPAEVIEICNKVEYTREYLEKCGVKSPIKKYKDHKTLREIMKELGIPICVKLETKERSINLILKNAKLSTMKTY